MAPEPEIKLAVRPGSHMDVEGQECLAFVVLTDKGSRICVFEETGGRLYEFGESGPISGLAQMTPETLKNFLPPPMGMRLSAVGADTIKSFTRIAEQNLAAEAIDLLLRKSDLDPAAMITAVRAGDGSATWYAVTREARIVVATFGDRADVVGSDSKAELTVTRAEIERHAAEAAVGRDSLEIRA